MPLGPSRGARAGLAAPPVHDVATDDARRYRALFQLAPDACVVTDRAGTILEANRAACDLLARPLQPLGGRPFATLVARADRRSFLARLAKLRFGRTLPDAEWTLRLQLPDGGRVDAAVAVVPMGEAAPEGGGVLLWRLRDGGARRGAGDTLRESGARSRSRHGQMRARRRQARALAAESLRVREEEARRIAHQLHDEAGQITATLHLTLQQLEEELPCRHRGRLRQMRALVLGLEDRLRSLSHELRPTILDDLGLVPAVGFLVESFSSRTGIAVEVKGDLGELRFDAQVETALYRFLQEALANVSRHAQAHRVVIEFERRAGAARCSITDDGTGFDPGAAARHEGGLGLIGIRERLEALGGRLGVRSAPGRGTRLVAALPARRWPSPAAS